MVNIDFCVINTMIMKITITFLSLLFLTVGSILAQPNWTGQYVMLGYRLGSAKVNISQQTNTLAIVNQQIGFNTSYPELRWGALNKHVYAEADASALILVFHQIISNKYVLDRPVKKYVSPDASPTNSNAIYGNDFSLFEGRIGFGGKGIYVGPQFNFYTNKSPLFKDRNSLAYGLHAAYLFNIEKVCRIKSTLMFNHYAKKGKTNEYTFKGNDITFDATAYFGKEDGMLAFYAGVNFTRKFGNKELPTFTGGTDYATYNSGSLFSFKIGVLLSGGSKGDYDGTSISIGSGSSSRGSGSSVTKPESKPTQSACNVCFGSGKTDCARCSGSGRIRVSATDPNNTSTQSCSSCNGSGKSTCSNCNGTGKK
jgi:hypothetical protein